MPERFYNFFVSNRGIVQITASAPTRIDLAGGTIDIWPLLLFHPGACTLNAAISLRAHATIEPRDDGQVELISVDTGGHVLARESSSLDGSGNLPLLSLMAREFGLENATLDHSRGNRRPARASPARRRSPSPPAARWRAGRGGRRPTKQLLEESR